MIEISHGNICMDYQLVKGDGLEDQEIQEFPL